MKRRDLFKAAAMALGSIWESRAGADTNHWINTVLGPVPPADLGRTLMHEHILVDLVGAGRIAPRRYDGGEVLSVVLPYLKQLRSQGCRTFVDCTPAYLGRDPDLLARLSQSSGLHTCYTRARRPAHRLPAAARDRLQEWSYVFCGIVRGGRPGQFQCSERTVA